MEELVRLILDPVRLDIGGLPYRHFPGTNIHAQPGTVPAPTCTHELEHPVGDL